MITQARVKEVFSYHPDGYLLWNKSVLGNSRVGKRAGVYSGRYATIGIDQKKYLVHRLIFLWHNGFLPKYVDHRDRNNWNNKIGNLRQATQSENAFNSKITRDNSTGFKNISRHKRDGKFYVHIKDKKGKIWSSGYDSLEFAVAAYNKKVKIFHGEFAVLNSAFG